MDTSTDLPEGRRRFLVRIVTIIHAAIATTIGVILGGVVSSPIFGRDEDKWMPAAPLDMVPENDPLPVTLRIAREDGYREVIDRRTVFLVRTGESEVIALDSTCTHLGCRVSWDSETKLIRCPCHGGEYDRTGTVTAGPPPAPLARLTTKIDGDQVLVQV
jgi:menaquinol-cytochrome c reductase iron-sulfur subunit